MNKEKLVPELRFSQYSEEWLYKSINSVFSIFNGYAFKSKDSKTRGCRWIKIADVGIGEIKSNNKSYLPSEYIDKYEKYCLNNGDYIVALTRPILNNKLKITKIGGLNKPALLNQRVGKVKSKNNLEFIYQMLQRNKLIFQIDSRIAGTDPPNLSPNEINTLMVGIPSSEEEQQKIANFLTAIDQRITLLKQKKAALEQYKKGLMQKIFNQEIRFEVNGLSNTSVTGREGEVSANGVTNAESAGRAGTAKDDERNDFPDWVEKKLGDVCNLQMGTSPKSSAYNNEGDGIPLIQGNADIKNRQSAPRVFTTEITKECHPNDLLLSVRAPVGEVSKSSHHACIGRGISAISPKTNTEIEFIFQFLLWYEPRWVSISQGSTFESVNSKDISGLRLKVPCIEEQQKIANFLSATDKKITTMDKQITETESFKKGLLQRMFV
ncbi:restriction endonuclease subunit S [Marinicella rhabdoformis]|uniref:restriction endonuclease subunit S n=1 Tax=Marinicella rhabdoformis TaxID=2580566 RepID=UPI0015D06FD4|nr:restriction endonuclease subunit S [Marinicella rhabdoformis]